MTAAFDIATERLQLRWLTLDDADLMLEVWNEEREKLALKSELNQQDLVSLGEKVLECMTSQDERNIVRSQITGLPEEKKQTGVMEF